MPDPMTELAEAMDRLRKMRKTVLCPPEWVAEVRSLIDQHSPVAGLYDVWPSAHTDGHIYIVDHSALRWWPDA